MVGAGLNRLGRRRTALSDHLARRLDSDHGSIGRFVGPGAGADIQDSLRRPERTLDDVGYPPIRLAKLRIIVADDVTIQSVDEKWMRLGLGEFLPSPSLKFKGQMYGEEAVVSS